MRVSTPVSPADTPWRAVSGYGKNAHNFIVRMLTELVGIDINTDGTRCHHVIYVLEQARFIVSHEGRNLPILITS